MTHPLHHAQAPAHHAVTVLDEYGAPIFTGMQCEADAFMILEGLRERVNCHVVPDLDTDLSAYH